MRIEPERRCEKTVEKGDRKKGDSALFIDDSSLQFPCRFRLTFASLISICSTMTDSSPTLNARSHAFRIHRAEVNGNAAGQCRALA